MINHSNILDIFIHKALINSRNFDSRIPSHQIDEDWKYKFIKGGGWTDSFWVGILNMAYLVTHNDEFLTDAEKYQNFFRLRVENSEEINTKQKFLPLDHDTGFIFSLSQVARYKLINDTEARNMAIRASDILCARYHERGKFIRAWDTWAWDKDEVFIEEKKGKFIVDSMMNLPLLFWAYEETKNKKYYNAAVNHAKTVMKYIVRKDYSTYHTFNMNHITGEPQKGRTGQGYHDESCWSRGQGWAIYGFALAYRYTKEKDFINTAEKLADFFYENLGNVKVPVWDFACKNEVFRPLDSSAAAIAACGMLELDLHIGNGYYYNMALEIIDDVTLTCSTYNCSLIEPFLLHGCIGPAYQKGKEKEIINPYMDTPLIYGDYFYFEALARIVHKNIMIFW